jgi:feruloyl esterase
LPARRTRLDGRAASALRIAKPLEANEAARLTQAQRQMLHAAVVSACDLHDGVKDGVIENPKSCTFDPGVLECKGTQDDSSFDDGAKLRPCDADLRGGGQPQHETRDYRSRARQRAGVDRPGMDGVGAVDRTRSVPLSGVRRPELDRAAVQFETDIVRAEEADNDTINALNPNLKPFLDRGGKLIQYHGWSDPQISPATARSTTAGCAGPRRGRQASRFVPAVHGARRGSLPWRRGPGNFDMLPALEAGSSAAKHPIRFSRSVRAVETSIARARCVRIRR